MGLKTASGNGDGVFDTKDGIHYDTSDKLTNGLIVYTSSNRAAKLGETPETIARKLNTAYNERW